MPPLRASTRHRLIGGGATAALVGLSALHLLAASAGDPRRDPSALVSAVLGTAGVLAALRLVTARCFESRLAMVLIGAATLVGVCLTHTIGIPGAAAAPWDGRDLLLAGLAACLTASWPATARRVADGCPR